MNNSKSSSSSGGIGFVGLLTILFIALKLCNVIQWSWVWVLSPIWISALLVAVILVAWLALYIAAKSAAANGRRFDRR